MIDYLDLDIKPLSRQLMKATSTSPIERRPPFTIVAKGIKKQKEKTHSGEEDIPFEKWIMPPQPEEYIKSRRFDFF